MTRLKCDLTHLLIVSDRFVCGPYPCTGHFNPFITVSIDSFVAHTLTTESQFFKITTVIFLEFKVISISSLYMSPANGPILCFSCKLVRWSIDWLTNGKLSFQFIYFMQTFQNPIISCPSLVGPSFRVVTVCMPTTYISNVDKRNNWGFKSTLHGKF